MKLLLTGMVIFFAMIILMLLWMARVSKTGSAPGLAEGKLLACSSHQNCVCTETGASIPPEPPLLLHKRYNAIASFSAAIEQTGGVIVTQTDNYLAATYTSSLFGFVDDVELRLDNEKQVLHIRSASRQGKSDLGVNRKRVAALKAQISKSNDSIHIN